MMDITASKIRYLLAVRKLGDKGYVRSVDVASSLSVSNPSAHRMISQLSKMNLIKKDKYSLIRLTEDGRNLAEEYNDCFLYLCNVLSSNLNFSPDVVEEAALVILSHLSRAKLETLWRNVGVS